MKRFTLWGTSFAKIGDEAQIVSVNQRLESVYDAIDVVLLDRGREKTRVAYSSIRTIRVRNAWLSLPRIARSDALIVIGAPFFESPRQVIHCLFVMFTAMIFRTPVLCYGITVFDYGTLWGEKLFAFLLNRVDRLAIREQIGTEIARRIGVVKECHLITDPRCLLNPASEAVGVALLKRAGIDPGRPLVGVTTRYMDENIPDWVKRNQGFSSETNKQANATIGAIIGDLAATAQILIIPMHKTPEEDAAMEDVVRRNDQNLTSIKLLDRNMSATECMAVMKHCDMLISSRLVSSVFGAALGVPTFSIAYDARMMGFVDSVGAKDHAVEWDTMNKDSVSAKVKEMWENRETVGTQRQYVADRLRRDVECEAHLLSLNGETERFTSRLRGD